MDAVAEGWWYTL
jgi:hypothetical protein